MATGKRFYWMKLKESFMTSDTIDYFMSQPDGANYVVLYQMLCLKTINTDLRRKERPVCYRRRLPPIQHHAQIQRHLRFMRGEAALCCASWQDHE